MKLCSRCGVEKDESQFNKKQHSGYRIGIDDWCKECWDSYLYDLNQKRVSSGLLARKQIIVGGDIKSKSDNLYVEPLKLQKHNSVCDIIKNHNEELKTDSERLNTDFLTSIICASTHRKKYLKLEMEKIKFDPDAKWNELEKRFKK